MDAISQWILQVVAGLAVSKWLGDVTLYQHAQRLAAYLLGNLPQQNVPHTGIVKALPCSTAGIPPIGDRQCPGER